MHVTGEMFGLSENKNNLKEAFQNLNLGIKIRGKKNGTGNLTKTKEG